MSVAEAPAPTASGRTLGGDYPTGVRAALSLAVICLVSSALTMDVSLVGLLIEPVKHALRLSDEQVGLLQGPASSIPYALCAIPAGLLIDRVSRVRLVFMALALWNGAMLFMAFAPSFWLFAFAKIAIGVSMAILLVGPTSLLADLVKPERRARATSVLMIGQYMGSAFGFLLGGLIFDWVTRHPSLLVEWTGNLEPWRIAYLLFLVPCIAMLPFLLLMREPPRHERRQHRPSVLASIRALNAHGRMLWPLVIASVFQVVADSSARIWLPPALMRLYHLTPGQFGGWIGGTVLASGIVGSALGGWLAERSHGRSSRMTAAVVAAVIAAGSSFLAVMPSVPLLFLLFVVGTIARGVITTVTSAMVITYMPNELRGLSSGISILVAVGPGLAIGPALVPAVSAALGGPLQIGAAIALVGVISGLLAALIFAFLRVAPVNTTLAE